MDNVFGNPDLVDIICQYAGKCILDPRLQELIEAGLVRDVFIDYRHFLQQNPRVINFVDWSEENFYLSYAVMNPNPEIVHHIVKAVPKLDLSYYARSPHVHEFIKHYKPRIDHYDTKKLCKNQYCRRYIDVRRMDDREIMRYMSDNPLATEYTLPILRKFIEMCNQCEKIKKGTHPTLDDPEIFRCVDRFIKNYYERECRPFVIPYIPDLSPNAIPLCFTPSEYPYAYFLIEFYQLKYAINFDKLSENPEIYKLTEYKELKNMFPEISHTKGYYKHYVKSIGDLKEDAKFEKFCQTNVNKLDHNYKLYKSTLGLFDNPKGATILKEAGLLEKIIEVYGWEYCLKFPDVHEAIPDLYERIKKGGKKIRLCNRFVADEKIFIMLADYLAKI